MGAAGFILTGGRSSRMGCDKALLPIGREPLVTRIAGALASVAEPVMLVGKPEKFSGLPWRCIPDLRPDSGPLAGIETALSHSAADLNLIVGCDMPGIQRDVLARLLHHASRSDAPCVLACDPDGRRHPLLAVYRRQCLPAIRAALDAGQTRLVRFVEAAGGEILPLENAVANVNTPDEWAQWKRDNGV